MTPILALFVLAAAVDHSEPMVLNCPTHLDTTQSLSSVVPGWHAFDYRFGSRDRKLPVVEMGVLSGPPENNFFLKPETTYSGKVGGDFVNRWPLQGYEDYSFYCGYAKTTIRLSMKLPAGLKHCSVEHRANRPTRAWCE
ncbi:hypothetical protein GCM10011521_14820 [Arenimonas soli]|uniref:Uncharacterized protein n=1 Tax=Arenimonas soli TaxID=2269504 RepID=A0ABQ1HJ09_9GAMM|nr:hypothetical protein GCM10011521_14820 [Arenimonas soli]